MLADKKIFIPFSLSTSVKSVEELEQTLLSYIADNQDYFIAGEVFIVRAGNDVHQYRYNEDGSLTRMMNADDTMYILKSGDTRTNLISDERMLIIADEDVDNEGILELNDKISSLNRQVTELTLRNRQMSTRLTQVTNILNDLLLGIGGGDLVGNSEKEELSNSADNLQPENATITYAPEENSTVASMRVLYGDKELGNNETFYVDTEYILEVRFINNNGETINEDFIDFSQFSVLTPSSDKIEFAVTDFDKSKLRLYSDSSVFNAQLNLSYGDVKVDVYINIENTEKPSYTVANTKHVYLKTAPSYDYLRENLSFLNLYELVWCLSDNGLYMKAETPVGNRLFKLNGSVTDDVIESNNGRIYMDENNRLIFEGDFIDGEKLIIQDADAIVDDEGRLLLKIV